MRQAVGKVFAYTAGMLALVLALASSALMPSVAFGAQDGATLAAGALASSATNDPYLGEQWALEAVGAFDAWDKVRTEGAVTVAVIDNGFYVDHADLKDNIVATYNAVTGSTDPSSVAPFSSGDSRWHGTHVSGIIAAQANNGKGIAGVSYNARLLLIKAFTSSTQFSSSALVSAYEFILEHADEYNIKVVNFSGGHPAEVVDSNDGEVVKRIKEAYDAGILTVCAAGNGAESGPYWSFPGDASDVALNVISLKKGSSSGQGAAYERAADSNYNSSGFTTKDIAAPGEEIYSTDLPLSSTQTEWYRTVSGTSQAAPCVAGVAALVYAAHEQATAAEVAEILCQTATDLGSEGWDEEYGYGMVNAAAAVQEALDRTDLKKAEVTLAADSYTYDGKAKQPAVSVTLRDRELVLGDDFTVEYSANTNAGTAKVVVKAAGLYHGSVTKEFSIAPATVQVPKPVANLVYTGDEQCGLKATTGCSVSGETAVSAGSHTATAKLNDANHCWPDGSVADRKITWTIAPKPLKGISVNGVPKYRYYTGKAMTFDIEVEHDGLLLEEGQEYRVSYKSNRNRGTASVVVTGCGNYTGTLTRTFKIIDKPSYAGASQMPVGADATWTLKNCTLKVVGGTKNCVSISGKKVHALRAGTVKIGVFNAAGVQVKTKSVRVYKIAGSLRQISLAKSTSYRIAFDASSKKSRATVRLHKGSLKKALRCRFVAKSDGTYYIVNSKSAYALAAKASGSAVQLAKKSTAKAQRWRIAVDSSNRLSFVNAKTGKTLCNANNKLQQKKSPSVASSTWKA